MNNLDLSKRPALWLGLRQAEAVRESVRISLSSQMLYDAQRPKYPPEFNATTERWLQSQGLAPAPWIKEAMDRGFEEGVGFHPDHLVRWTDRPSDEWADLGAARAGAGW